MSEHDERESKVRVQPDCESRQLAERLSGKAIAKRIGKGTVASMFSNINFARMGALSIQDLLGGGSARQKSEIQTWEVKVLVVGSPDVGKTSLVDVLVKGNPLQVTYPEPSLIELTRWNAEIGDRELQLQVWDFAGKEHKYASHEYFLTDRSVYLLLWDTRHNLQLDYWLESICALGPDAKVLIVRTKVDNDTSTDRQNRFLNCADLMQRYPDNIVGFHEISCMTGEGLQELKANILSQSEQLMGKIDWTRAGLQVRNELVKLRETENYLDNATYQHICQKHDVPKKERDSLLVYLHALGVVTCFQDKSGSFKHAPILNPYWITEAIEAVLNAPAAIKAGGLLTLKQLGDILSGQTIKGKRRFPANTYPIIRDVMLHVGEAIPMPNDHFLMLGLMPVDDAVKPPAKGQHLVLDYPHLPRGLFRRTVAALQDYVDRKRLSRSCVWLQEPSGAEACLQFHYRDQRISITFPETTTGRHRRELRTVIQEALERESNRAGISATASISVKPDDFSVLVPLDHLCGLRDSGRKDFIPYGSNTPVNVRNLLDELEESPVSDANGMVGANFSHFHGNVENFQQVDSINGPNVQNGHIDMGNSQQTYTIGQAMNDLRTATTEQVKDEGMQALLQQRIDELEHAAKANDTDRVKTLFGTISSTITTAKTIAAECTPLAAMLGTLLGGG